MNTGQHWFEECQEQSEVKAAIVAKYFWAWAKVIVPSARKRPGRIAYIDLFAGPGRYKDGTHSTPLLVLQRAIEDPDLRQMLVTVFNDADSGTCSTLQETINALPGIDTLKHAPQVHNYEVGDQVVAMFEQMHMVPTLFFVDPWGYKGLSLRLVNSVLKDWGCDCIFFFNYNRISMGISNEVVEEHMDALFGHDRAEALRPALKGLAPADRELAIVESLCDALKAMGGRYVLPFRFRRPDGARTSHHLIFVSKHSKGYTIMKEIMAGESSTSDQGVPSFEYNYQASRQGLLFELSRPLDDLRGMLLEKFVGRTLTCQAIFDRHNIDTPFIMSNYKEVLGQMELDGTVKVTRPPKSPKLRNGKPTFGPKTTITFPGRRRPS